MPTRLTSSKTATSLLVAGICTIAFLSLHGQDATAPKPASPASNKMPLAEFGVVGDGVHDDSAAIQRAVDSGIGDIAFGKGVYRLTKTVVIDLDKVGYTTLRGNGVARFVMEGPGAAFKFVGTHFKSADPGGFTPHVWERQRMPLVDGLAIEGKHRQASGIAAVGTMQLTVTRTHIRNALHGIHLLENNRNVIVADCHIYENRGVGIFYDQVNLHQSNITNCHISYNGGGGVVSIAGNVRNIHISGCDLESNMTPDGPPTANVLIDSAGSQSGTGEVAITGCTIQHNNPSASSANIRILGRSARRGAGDAGTVREGNVTITGNVLSDVQVNIHLRDCRGVAISGNTIWKGFQHNLLVEDCSNIVVGPNSLDRNPRYNYGNSLSSSNSVVFRNCVDCTVTGLHLTNVHGPAGLLLDHCIRFNVTGCTILDCDNVGMLVKQTALSRVSDCLIRDDRPESKSVSLRVVGGNGNLFADNSVSTPPEFDD